MAKKTSEATVSVDIPVDITVEIPEDISIEFPKDEAVKESIYTAEELAANYKLFNTSYAIVAVALRLAGKDKATLAEAEEIINKFKNKEVK